MTEPERRPPGRAGLGMRDMVGAMVVLLVIIGVLVAITRGCSFDPGAPASDPSTAPSVDASAKLREAAGTVGFPVRQPSVPAGWRANSSATAPIGTGADADVVVRVGWLTPSGRYVQLSQSGGQATDVVAAEAGESGARSGSVSVDGVSWDRYPARRDEVAWVASFADVVVLITGSGSETEFRQLATATQDTNPLPD